MPDLIQMLIQDFLKNSRNSIDALLMELYNFMGDKPGSIAFYTVERAERKRVQIDRNHYFLRASTEYANPQLAVEELQGIIASRLLEVCCNYMGERKITDLCPSDIAEVSEMLKKPPTGLVMPFLLNTDDVEPDRYSINPLRASIVESGQSAFPAASVITNSLSIDSNFLAKYEGSLISKSEVDLIEQQIRSGSDKYVDLVDAVKYETLQRVSEALGMYLCIPAFRMPLEVMKNEKPKDPLHKLIEDSHREYSTIEAIYELMGRNMGKRKTLLLTVPHSSKGFGSKRAAQGSIAFMQEKFEQIKVHYKTTLLYANELDVNETDVSVAKAEDSFSVEANRILDYDYAQTPSSPQFALYATLSPEDAAIWHGIGVFGGVELVKSIISVRAGCLRRDILEGVSCRGNKAPLQLNLVPGKMWRHPKYGNIDTSVGCVSDLASLIQTGICLEPLSVEERLSTTTRTSSPDVDVRIPS